MIINVKVIPKARKEKIEREGEILKVYVKEKAEKGKANKRVLELLSEFFNVKKSQIRIVSGEKQRKKVIEIKK